MEYLNLIWQNIDNIMLAITSIIACASAIAAITPTPKDDTIIKKIASMVDVLALNIGHAKEV